MPATNPYRAIGRNDPCPCGSGKKFKKCCLGKNEEVSPGIDELFELPPGAEPIDRMNQAVRKYDPLIEPNPRQWLTMDDQQRIDLVLAYHRSTGVAELSDNAHALIHVVVENQIADDKLPVRHTARRLMSEGLDRHDAIHAIGSVLVGNMNDLICAAGPNNQPGKPKSEHDPKKAYFAKLERLTAETWLRSA